MLVSAHRVAILSSRWSRSGVVQVELVVKRRDLNSEALLTTCNTKSSLALRLSSISLLSFSDLPSFPATSGGGKKHAPIFPVPAPGTPIPIPISINSPLSRITSISSTRLKPLLPPTPCRSTKANCRKRSMNIYMAVASLASLARFERRVLSR